LTGLARQSRWAIAGGLAALLGVDLLQLYVPRLVKFAVDDLTLGRATGSTLAGQGLAVLGLALGMGLLRLTWRPLIMGFSRRVELDLRGRIFAHLQRLHLGWYASHPPGEIMSKATNDLNNIRMATGIGLVAALDGVVLGLTAVGFMLYISPLLTLLALAPMPLIVALTRLQTKKLHRNYTEVQESFSTLTEQAREALAAIGLVKAYALTERQIARLEASGRGYLTLNLTLARTLALFFPLMTFVTALSLAIVLGGGGAMAVLGRITPGDFVAFASYLGILTWPMMALGWVVSLIQRAGASLARVEEVLSTAPAITDPAAPRPLPAGRPLGLAIKGLTFAYPGSEEPALTGVDLEIPAGGTTAIVGRVGCGKSTLLHLLGRLHDPPPGTVFLGGVDVRELAQAELRAAVVQVPQEAFVFSATLRSNLVMGAPQAEDDALWRALTAAELAEEARALPQGLDTLLGERGHTLSGGQRQRLCLARALLLEPEVLVLDDPLSAVDTETEGRILANLARLRAGRTTLMVSHRLASVAFCSLIHVMERGRVVQRGGHQELLAAGGIYASLFSEQALMAELEG
jgi:ATP-binding cassette subfamily B protein